MVTNHLFIIKTWAGDEKSVKKIVFFPEIDNKGELFYKIEGQLNTDFFMINYYYDEDIAKAEYYKLLDEMVKFQVKCLLKV